MAKSVNDYYAEKMKRLLEMQKQEDSRRAAEGRSLPPSPRGQADAPRAQQAARTPTVGQQYYNSFRNRNAAPRYQSGESPAVGQSQRGEKAFAGAVFSGNAARTGQAHAGQPYAEQPYAQYAQRTRPDASRAASYTAPRVRTGGAGTAGRAGQSAQGTPPRNSQTDGARQRKNTSPEQTAADRNRERLAREEALQNAKKARKVRKARDTIISFALIIAVFAVMCVVVYRLLFKVSEINVVGSESYTAEEIIEASGIGVGDHLYSFRASILEKNVILRCPQVKSVEVNRSAPKKVTLTVSEEPCAFYADFYGEYRAVSADLRVLYSVTRDEAQERGLVLLRLPAVTKAVAGSEAKYSSVRRDDYIYTVTEALQNSELWGRVSAVDLTGKYDIEMVCDGKYLLTLGDSSAVESKLRIGAAVLSDEMFDGDDKAKIDLANLSETGVVVDNRLELDW
ncbi:MAG: cell division protein FtsQ/DivIB [Candidatus Avispirillum sp.]